MLSLDIIVELGGINILNCLCVNYGEQVAEEHAKFNMLLKVKRGSKEEKFKAEVHKNMEGAFSLNHMEADHS